MRILEFALASALIELTPGPNMSYLAALALARGYKVGFAAIAGVASGLLIVGLMAAFGLAKFVDTYPALGSLLRWGGVLFMLWLAFESWYRAGREDLEGPNIELSSYWRGLITNLLNPKLFIFYIVLLPEFIDGQGGGVLLQNITLVAFYTSIATIIHLGIVLFAGHIHTFVNATKNARMIGRVMAVLLAGVAVWLFFEVWG